MELYIFADWGLIATKELCNLEFHYLKKNPVFTLTVTVFTTTTYLSDTFTF